MIVREWKKEDNEAIARLEEVCFKTPWNKDMLDSCFIRHGFYGVVAEENGDVVGYVGAVYDEWDGELLNLAVAPEHRRKGYALRLMEELLEYLSKKEKENVFLEVRRSNAAAISLYTRLGFEKIGERKKYYENTEDALIFARKTR